MTALTSPGATARGGAQAGQPAQTPVEGTTALKAEPHELPWNHPRSIAADRRAEAKAKGYEGDPCEECGNFTLVRNGTCMKCDTCGSTTGCS